MTPESPQQPAGARRFDPEWVSANARQSDPSLSPETAGLLAGQAWEQLQGIGDLDAPELSRRLLADNDGASPTETNTVATAAVAFCQTYGLMP